MKFRKRDIAPLHSFPSAADSAAPKAPQKPRKIDKGPKKAGAGTWLWRVSALIMLLVGLALGAIYLLLSNGISSDRLSSQAQTALGRFLGPEFDAALTGTRVALDSVGNLAIEADGVSVRDKRSGRQVGSLQTVKLGISAVSLLRGELDAWRIEISNAEFDLTSAAALTSDPLALFRNKNGQLSGQQLVSEIFARTSDLVAFTSKSEGQKIALTNVLLRYGRADSPSALRVNSLEMEHKDQGQIEASGFVTWLDMPYRITGAVLGADTFTYEIAEFPLALGANAELKEPDGTPTLPRLKSLVGVKLAGSAADGAKILRADVGLTGLAVNTGRNRIIDGSGALNFEMRSDVEKAEILPSFFRFGSNYTEFTGALGPDIAEASKGYRYELVTSRASWDSAGSPEPAVDISGQLRGTFDPLTKVALISELGLRTLSGEMSGSGSLTFEGTSPRSVFALRIPRLSIAHAKQIWPVNIAFGARAWVFEHVYGGTFSDSAINIDIPAGRYGGPVLGPLPNASEFSADFNVSGARFDVMGDLPPVRDAAGIIHVRGADTDIELKSGTAYLESNQSAAVSEGRLLIPYARDRVTIADLVVHLAGDASALAAIAAREPVNAMAKAPFAASDLSGPAKAKVIAKFPFKKSEARERTVWSAEIALKGVSVKKPFDGQTVSDATGTLSADKSGLKLDADANLNGIPAKLKLDQPFGDSGKRNLSVQLELGEKARAKLAPGLNQFVKGPIYVDLQTKAGAARQIKADLTKATVSLDFVGWSKGAGVPAEASFVLANDEGRTILQDFELTGESFSMRGSASLDKSGLASADLSNVKLVRGDSVAARVTRTKGGYAVKVSGDSLDVRALVKKITGSFDSAAKSVGSTGITVNASIGRVTGFNGEALSNLQMSYSGRGSRVDSLKISAATDGGGAVTMANRNEGGQRQVQIQSADAGSILRFFDYYDKMRGGSINIGLSSEGDGPLRGSIDARNFTLINEPRMRSLVGGRSAEGGPSLRDAVKKDIDVSKVKFSKGYANILKGKDSLSLDNGILRGELIGLSFRGAAYDEAGRINLSGTFMPAYGLNRIFGEIPILGQILGNGEERGLIGITFKLSGKAKSPQLTVNPISVIAPGIFRQIFEFQ